MTLNQKIKLFIYKNAGRALWALIIILATLCGMRIFQICSLLYDKMC